MIQATIKQFPMLLFSIFVSLCIAYDEYRLLLLVICAISTFWLAYAHKYQQFTYKSLFKPKIKK